MITGQDVITLEQLRQSQVIRSQISTVNATANANVTVMNAAATATGYMTTQSTSARLFNDYMNARGEQHRSCVAHTHALQPPSPRA